MNISFPAFLKSLPANALRLSAAAAAATTTGITSPPLTLVLGNESADLDSMVTSITLAYILSQTESTMAIPILNTNRSDLRLRPDCSQLLSSTLHDATLGETDLRGLTFIDDFDLPALAASARSGGLNVWLADHNAPSSGQRYLEPLVRGIIDHHVDEGRCLDAPVRVLEPVGSCATLVGGMLRETCEEIHPALAKMILAPIVLDTSSLSGKEGGRTTAKDRAVASWLLPQVRWSTNVANITDDADTFTLDVSDMEALYRALDKLKGQTSHLSSYDLLRKDYKQWEVLDANGLAWQVGISSVGMRMPKWLARDGRK
ncbi:Exopolyphosphatase, partial [Kickxella alabastrina]